MKPTPIQLQWILKEAPEYHICKLSESKGRLYYHKGNFYYPVSTHPMNKRDLEKGIRTFSKEHKDMIARDRKAPGYMTPWEMVDLEPYCV